jgi:hypothetical protein
VTRDNYFSGTAPSYLLRNLGNLQFQDVTDQVGLSGILGFGVSTSDLNGDGWPDLVFADTAPSAAPGSFPAARIFISNRDGTFHELSNATFGWATYGNEDYSAGVSVGDLNRDGLPDIVIGQHYESTSQGRSAPIRAYLNSGTDPHGDPGFREITTASGLVPLATKSPDVQIGDFDNDGWPDILTSASSAEGTRPVVFRNTGVVNGTPQFALPPRSPTSIETGASIRSSPPSIPTFLRCCSGMRRRAATGSTSP